MQANAPRREAPDKLSVKRRTDQKTGREVYEYVLTAATGALEEEYSCEIEQGRDQGLKQELMNTALSLDEWVSGASTGIESKVAKQAGRNIVFERLGALLTRVLLPPAVERFLASSDRPLLISTNDPAFPWPVVRINDQFLGLRRPIGVQVRVYRSRATGPGDGARSPLARQSRHPRALFIADPTGDRPATFEEAEQVEALLSRWTPQLQVERLVHARATITAVSAALADDFDFIHYAGHAQFEEISGGRRALLLADGDLPARDIPLLSRSNPVVFLNACWAGAAKITYSTGSDFLKSPDGRPEGFAVEFVRSGARLVVAPIWPVFDGCAHNFAILCYQFATTGMPLGEVLRQARAEILRQRPWDPTWAVYTLYGDPTETLAELATRQPAAAASGTSPRTYPAAAPGADAHRAPGHLRGDSSGGGSQPPSPDDSDTPDAPESSDASSSSHAARLAEKLRAIFLKESDLRFAPDAAALFDRTFRLVLRDRRAGVHTLDLLVAIALTPSLPIAAALAAQGCDPAELRQYAHDRFADEQFEEEPDGIGLSNLLDDITAAAADIAIHDERQAITALDLTEGLLADAYGSTARALRSLRVSRNILLAIVRQTQEQRRAQLPQQAASTPDGISLEGSPAPEGPDGAVPTMFDIDPFDPGAIVDAAQNAAQNAASDATLPAAPAQSQPNPRQLPPIPRFVRDLRIQARQHRLRPLWGRGAEVAEVARILGGSHPSAHVLLSGPRGVGKWAVVEALAHTLESPHPDGAVARLNATHVLAIDPSFEAMPTGSAATRLSALAQALRDALSLPLPLAIAIRNVPDLIPAPGSEAASHSDGSDPVSAALDAWVSALRAATGASGVSLLLTAADVDRQARWLPAELARQFTSLTIAPPTPDQVRIMLARHQPRLQSWSPVVIPPPVLSAAAQAHAKQGGLAQPGLGVALLTLLARSHPLLQWDSAAVDFTRFDPDSGPQPTVHISQEPIGANNGQYEATFADLARCADELGARLPKS